MIFTPPKARGLALGLTALALLLGLAAALAAAGGAAGAGALSLLGLAAGLALGPAIAFVAYRCYGLARGRYILSRNALVVDWGWRRELLPLPHLRAVRLVTEPAELAALRPRGLWWPGCLVGHARLPEGTPVEFLAGDATHGLVLIHTAERVFALSPADPTAFAEIYAQLQAQRPTAEIEPVSVVPALFSRAVWGDWRTLALTGGSGLTGLGLCGYLLLSAPPAAAPLPRLPAIVGLTWGVNTLLGLWLRRRPGDAPLAYLVWGATFFTQALVLGAALNP